MLKRPTEPDPPLGRKRPIVKGPKFDQAVRGAGNEEEQDGVEQNVLVQSQHPDV